MMLRHKLSKILIPLMLPALLSGCAAISAISSAATPLQNYELLAPTEVPKARRQSSLQLVVEVPDASGGLLSERIQIRPNPLQAQYLADGQWATVLPVMMQSLMVRSLEESGGFRSVSRRPVGPYGDYQLLSEISDFQAEVEPQSKALRVHLRLSARLVRESDAQVVSSRVFTAITPIASSEALDLVAGLNNANQQILRELTAWVVQGTGVGLQR